MLADIERAVGAQCEWMVLGGLSASDCVESFCDCEAEVGNGSVRVIDMMKRSQHSRPYMGPSSDFGIPAVHRLYNRSLRMVDDNEAEAFRLNELAAHEGMHDAVLAMGWFYLNGVGVPEDENEAYKWYRKSARQGDARALFSLGQIAYWKSDFAAALTWFTRAEDKQHHRSQFWLGKMYWRGNGVPQNRKRARQLFAEAARKKVTEAQRTIRFLDYCARSSDRD
ncbi:MAG TPA: tetratricopeptide repeat protein [Acidobacteriaceae bacterium]